MGAGWRNPREKDFAVVLELLAKVYGAYRLSRMGSLLNVILTRETVHKRNVFFLTLGEKAVYFYQLLKQDADIFLCVLDLVRKRESSSLSEMQYLFQDHYIERLLTKLRIVRNDNVRGIVMDRLNLVRQWRNPRRYVEDIVPTRLNWLLDLGLLDPSPFSRHRCVLSQPGAKLTSVLEHSLHYSDVTDQWLSRSFFQRCALLLDTREHPSLWDVVPQAVRTERCQAYLKSAFATFSSVTVPRLSLNQAIMYVCLQLAINDQIYVDQENLEDWLIQNPVLGSYRYQVIKSAREWESYIVVTG